MIVGSGNGIFHAWLLAILLSRTVGRRSRTLILSKLTDNWTRTLYKLEQCLTWSKEAVLLVANDLIRRKALPAADSRR